MLWPKLHYERRDKEVRVRKSKLKTEKRRGMIHRERGRERGSDREKGNIKKYKK